MITATFVYGTLMPGGSRWHLVEPFVAGDPAPDRIAGRLLDTGCGYPALVDLGADTLVDGWVVPLDVDHLDEALDRLDAVEGTDAGLFTRVAVTTVGARPCWTYRYELDVTGMREINGAWDVR